MVCEGCGLLWDDSNGLSGSVHEGVKSTSYCYELCAAYEGFQYGATVKKSGKCICAAGYDNPGPNENWNIYSVYRGTVEYRCIFSYSKFGEILQQKLYAILLKNMLYH